MFSYPGICHIRKSHSDINLYLNGKIFWRIAQKIVLNSRVETTAQTLTRFQVIVPGMGDKLVTSCEQNMLHTKS